MDDLKSLILSAQMERTALSTALSQVELHAPKVSSLGSTLQQVSDEASSAETRLDALATRVATFDERIRGIEEVDIRVKMLLEAVGQAEAGVQYLVARDGALEKHRETIQTLAAQSQETQSSLEALKDEQHGFEGLRAELQAANAQTQRATEGTADLRKELEQLRAVASKLTTDYGSIWETARESREHATEAAEAAKDVGDKMSALAQLHDLTKDTDQRLSSLNAMAEHVNVKVKSLEQQKATVEHAVVESNRLSEMVWRMDEQIARLGEGMRQAAQAEETVGKVEKLAKDASGRLDAGAAAQQAFARDVAKLDATRKSLAQMVEGYSDRLAVEKRELGRSRSGWAPCSAPGTPSRRGWTTWPPRSGIWRRSIRRPRTWGNSCRR